MPYATGWRPKIWALMRAGGITCSMSSVERAMRRRNLLQPITSQAERCSLAKTRRLRLPSGNPPQPAATITAVEVAIAEVERLLDHTLLGDLVGPATGETTVLRLVTDIQRSTFRSAAFAHYIASRPELTHV